jgi:hypothetical protein
VIKTGARLRGDHPAVLWAPDFFVIDGSDDAEVAQARNALLPRERVEHAEHEFAAPAVTKPASDETALVAIRPAGRYGLGNSAVSLDGRNLAVDTGTRVPPDHPAVKADPSAFVKVCSEGVDPSNALRATRRMSCITDGTKRIVHLGQLVSRDDPFVAIWPWFELA